MPEKDDKQLLLHDVASTLGNRVGADAKAYLAYRINDAWSVTWANETAVDRAQRAVDDVQQVVHDEFIDTTWPACPRHPNHPLWFREGWWWCEMDGVAIAKLGELKADA